VKILKKSHQVFFNWCGRLNKPLNILYSTLFLFIETIMPFGGKEKELNIKY
jgi:hypothetical protein